MSGREPAREEHNIRCSYCGANVEDRETAEITAEYGSGIEVAEPFCSDACAKAYRAQEQENIEEFREVFRAGAT